MTALGYLSQQAVRRPPPKRRPPAQLQRALKRQREQLPALDNIERTDAQHFTRENIKRALDGEFYFYSRIFNFTSADEL